MENLWFNEDGDCVWGYKSFFESEDAFKKAANDIHVKQTQYGCILGEIECDVFIMTEKTLQGESSYPLKDSGVEIATLYYADCESLESYDLKDGNGTVKLNDGTVIDLKGKIIKISKRETDMNNSNINYMVCDLCNEKLHPLDAHTGKIKDKFITSHIDCWNEEIEKQ